MFCSTSLSYLMCLYLITIDFLILMDGIWSKPNLFVYSVPEGKWNLIESAQYFYSKACQQWKQSICPSTKPILNGFILNILTWLS